MYCVPVNNCVSSVIPLFFDVFTPDICLVCVMRVEISLFNRIKKDASLNVVIYLPRPMQGMGRL